MAARGKMQELMVSQLTLGVQLNVACSGGKAWAQRGAGGHTEASACPACGGLKVCSKGCG